MRLGGLSLLLLAPLHACGSPTFLPPACDTSVPAVGEVRAYQLACNDELISDGDARVGDYMLENAHVRFGFRGVYSALYGLDEAGGTLVDAVARTGDGGTTPDALGEVRVDGDRTAMYAESDSDEGRLVLPGMTWHLAVDEDTVRVTMNDGSSATATVTPLDGVARTGTTWQGDGFFGTDGSVPDDGHVITTAAVSWVTPFRYWWTATNYGSTIEARGRADADDVAVQVNGAVVTRLPVANGTYDEWVPSPADLRGERTGCAYMAHRPGPALDAPLLLESPIRPIACGAEALWARDESGNDVTATFVDGSGVRSVLPPGGGSLPLGLGPMTGTVSAGPAFAAVTLDYEPTGTATATLTREMDTDGAILADLRRNVYPDPDAPWSSAAAVHDATGDGVGYTVIYADDEVPTAAVDPTDVASLPSPPLAVAAVQSHAVAADGVSDGGSVLSWPWDPAAKKPGHGAPPHGLSALALLAVAHDNSTDRRTIVDRTWAETALAEAPGYAWQDEPNGLWLDSLDDLDVYLELLGDYVNVAPVGPRTWIELPTGDDNVPGVEAGLYAGETTAGTGPRIEVLGGFHVGTHRVYDLQVDAPLRATIDTITLYSPDGTATFNLDPLGEPFGGGTVRVDIPDSAPWVVATVSGADGWWAVRAVR